MSDNDTDDDSASSEREMETDAVRETDYEQLSEPGLYPHKVWYWFTGAGFGD